MSKMQLNIVKQAIDSLKYLFKNHVPFFENLIFQINEYMNEIRINYQTLS